MPDFDSRFFRALIQGAVAGALGLWAALTAVFLVLTDQSVVVVAGFSAMPALFCGPFLGGLFTTSRLHEDEPAVPLVVVPLQDEGQLAA